MTENRGPWRSAPRLTVGVGEHTGNRPIYQSQPSLPTTFNVLRTFDHFDRRIRIHKSNSRYEGRGVVEEGAHHGAKYLYRAVVADGT